MKQFKLLSDMVIGGYALKDDSQAVQVMRQAKQGQSLTLYKDSLIMEQGNKKQFVRLLNVRERKQVSNYLVKRLDDRSPYDYESPEYWRKVKAYESRVLQVHQFNIFTGPYDPTFWLIFNHYLTE